MTQTLEARPWSSRDAEELYRIPKWGQDFVGVNERGHLTIRVPGQEAEGIDLKMLVDEVVERGISPPLLVRVSDLLHSRIDQLHAAFAVARSEYGYAGEYRPVYPIKVNQDRILVEDLVAYGRRYNHGLEAGSKSELLAVTAMLDDPDALVICNGYKDADYVETALLASRLGPKLILVVEKPSELEMIADLARRTAVRPLLGVRARLSSRGAGHWEDSGGEHSKFGLSARELMSGVRFLRQQGLLDSLILLHFHLGSQISAIRSVKEAVREASWIYVNLRRIGVPLVYLDVGGGLGVDYDGNRTSLPSSMNYTLQEYANDIVYGVLEVCEEHDIEHPILVTESGRATVAHHALLVVEVFGVGDSPASSVPEELPAATNPVVASLLDAYRELRAENARETFHDALQYRHECMALFTLGHLLLEDRVVAEEIFSALCTQARKLLQGQPGVEDELREIERQLAVTYFANFSVFQSLPDSWAIDQLFPIVPIHRLDERPGSPGVVADVTCDSDGRIDHFIGDRERRAVLDLHPMNGEPYYLGIFMVGAYQEILGDLHNLFGDTNAVHVSIDPGGGYQIDHVVEGDTVHEVLDYVGYRRGDLLARMRRRAESAIRDQRMSRDQLRELLRLYQKGLDGSTYLEQRSPL